MTAATLSRLPLMAGGTLVGSVGRGGFWTATRLLDLGFWAAGQFMRAPVAVSAVVAVVGLSAIAGANALYFQHERHPAPLFFSPPKAAVAPPHVAPVLPAPRPRLPVATSDSDVTGSIARQAAQPITAGDIKAVQAKLIAMRLLDGDADGIYGPHTAIALRVFESRHGLRPDGRLTPAVFAAVQNATLPPPEAAPAVTAAIASPTGPVKPVPLAPLPAAPAMASPPDAQAATAPAAASATTPLAAAASAVPPAPPAAALNAAAAQPAPATADTFAANAPADGGGPATDAPGASGATFASRENVAPTAAPAPVDPASATSANLTAAQRLAAQFGTLPPGATAAEAMPNVAAGDDSQGSTDPVLITQIQKGLASLGFLADKIDGVPGEGTAKAIRNFQVFYDYKVTGLATHQLLGLLVQHGAAM